MKKKMSLLRWYLLPCLLFVFFACGDDEKAEDPKLTVEPATIEVSSDGAQDLAVVVTANVDWTATVNPADTWCTIVSPATGSGNGTLTVSVEPNITFSARETVITVTSKDGTIVREIAVKQALYAVTEEFLTGDWQLQQEGHPANGFYFALVIVDGQKVAQVYVDPSDPSVFITGTWTVENNVVRLSNPFMGEIVMEISKVETQPEKGLFCNLKIPATAFSGYPTEGIANTYFWFVHWD
jgi:hypothetical protein